jgi:uncharacterized protein YjiS (DUF1127 family)
MGTTMMSKGIAKAIRDYSDYRRTMRQLAWLSDRDLSDLGITRSDIRSVARGEADIL